MFKQRTVFAYEPAWAIGTGNFAQPEEANEMHEMIRKIITEKNATYAKYVKIIYGGSMTPDNSEATLLMENIDGGLVGRCSIDPSAFTKICEPADRFKCGVMAQ
jgi:triosephosphate isomerase